MTTGFSALLTNCSARKSARSAPGLSSTALEAGTQDVVADQWIAKITVAPATNKASELYAGRGVKRMHRLADRLDVPLYISSAGLGLLRANTVIPSYDLSVSNNNPSAVQRRIAGGFVPRKWWRTVQQSRYATPLSEAFGKPARGLVLIAASNAYVPLFVGDLLQLSDEQRGRLRLFGAADARYPSELRVYLMPYDARLDDLVRGSKVDFAQRAVEHFVLGASSDNAFPADVEGQREWVKTRLSSVAAKVRPNREVVDDERIRKFAKQLADQGLSYTNALNALRREHGIACEQSRFRRLFREVTI